MKKMVAKRIKSTDELTCCICGKKMTRENAHDPYPVRQESWYEENENRCCTSCNDQIVVPIRRSFGRHGGGHHEFFKEMNYMAILQFMYKQAV